MIAEEVREAGAEVHGEEAPVEGQWRMCLAMTGVFGRGGGGESAV